MHDRCGFVAEWEEEAGGTLWVVSWHVQMVRVDELAVDLDKIVVGVDGRLSRRVVSQCRRGQRGIGDRVVERLCTKVEDVNVEELVVGRE